VITWQKKCIAELSKQELVTITDIMLLSYQVVQASVIMSQARMVIQAELLDIVTLSINDTINAQIQAQSNDLAPIKNAIIAIESAQEKIKFACNALKKFGPLIIHINPIVIQLFISNLKDIILIWSKMQENTITSLEEVHLKLNTNNLLFSDLKNAYISIVSNEILEHSQLLHGANILTEFYKKTENILKDLTCIRQEGITKFNEILTLFFKYHYQALYDQFKNIHDENDIHLIGTDDHTLPEPQEIFLIV
jgi:hypothetical protein